MIDFVLGAPRSGKSLYAERLVAQRPGYTLYVGTLPSRPDYAAIIADHRARRPREWDLLECHGAPEQDLPRLRSALSAFDNIIVDGLLVYVLRFVTLFRRDLSAFKSEVTALLESAAHGATSVVVVDSPVPVEAPAMARRHLHGLHLTILRWSSSIVFVDHHKARPISKVAAGRVSRCALAGTLTRNEYG